MQRVLRDAPRTLQLELTDADGTLVTDATAATLAVSDIAGVALTGSPFTCTGRETGSLEATLPAAATAVLGLYDLLWTIERPSGTELRRGQIEVVGGHTYDIAEIRARYAEWSDPEAMPASRLRRNRDAVEDLFERYTRPAMYPRARTVVLDGDGCSVLFLPDMYVHAITSATVGGVALDGGELDALSIDASGIVRRATGAWTWGHQNISTTYEHGLRQVPEDIHDAAVALARATLTQPATPDRATSISTDSGSFRLTIAGKDGPSGLPIVDAVLERWGAGNNIHVA